MTDQERIQCLEELLKLIAADWNYFHARREQAFTEDVKSYYTRKLERIQLDYTRIERRVRKLKAAVKEETS